LDGLRSSYYRDLAEHERVKPAALRAYEDKLTQATSDLDAARPRAMQEIKRLEGFAFSPKERARRLEGISKARGEIGDLVARQRAAEKSLRDARLAFDGTEAVLASRKMAIPTAEAAVEQAAQAMQRSQMARRVRIAATAGSTGAAVGALGFSL
jgi:chromosome segregation ATPase